MTFNIKTKPKKEKKESLFYTNKEFAQMDFVDKVMAYEGGNRYFTPQQELKFLKEAKGMGLHRSQGFYGRRMHERGLL